MGLASLLQKLRSVVFSNVVPALKGVSLIAPAGNGSSQRILHVCLCRNADFWSGAFVLGTGEPQNALPRFEGAGFAPKMAPGSCANLVRYLGGVGFGCLNHLRG